MVTAPDPRVPAPPPVVRLLGVPLHRVGFTQAVEHIAASAAARVGGWVLTPNLDIVRRLVKEREFAELCEGVTLRLADGMPLVWASRLKRTPLPERVAGSDMIWRLSERAAKDGLSIFLLGGNPGAAEDAAAILQSRFPGLHIAGTECPAPGFENDPVAMQRLRKRLTETLPNIVYVALGSPKQERLIRDLRSELPHAWWLGIGISFSYVSGEVRRAPVWVQRLGFEWLHRLIQEPGRLAKRYLVQGLPFAARLLLRSLLEGLGVLRELQP